MPKELIKKILLNDYELLRISTILCKQSREMLYKWLDENGVCRGIIQQSIQRIKRLLYDHAMSSMLCCYGDDDFIDSEEMGYGVPVGTAMVIRAGLHNNCAFMIVVNRTLVVNWPGCCTCDPVYSDFNTFAEEMEGLINRNLVTAALLDTGICYDSG